MGINQTDGNGTRNKLIFVALLVAAAIFSYNHWFSSDAAVRNGYELYRNGKWEEGRDAFREAIKRNPQNANAYLGLARGFLHPEMGECIKAYSKALEFSPNNVIAYLERAQNQRGAEAIQDCKKALELGSLQRVSYCVRAEVRQEMKDYPNALADCERALELEPKSVRAYIARADIYRAQKQYEQAAADYRKAMDVALDKDYREKLLSKEYARDWSITGENLKPDFMVENIDFKYHLYFECGLGYVVSGQRDAAVTSVADAGDERSLFLDSFGDDCYKRKQYSDAVFYYTQALKDTSLKYYSGGIYVDRGNAYRMQGDYAHALADYTSAVNLEIQDDELKNNELLKLARNEAKGNAYFGCGCVYHEQKDIVRAIENYTKSIELHPTADAYNNRGNCYEEQGDVAQAVADYTKAIWKDLQKNATYYNNRGRAYQKLGKTELAAADFAKAKKLEGK